MMTSVDGRIDCAMTSQLPGVEDYYKTLDGLNVPTTVSGRVTAELEMAEPGFFEAKNSETYTQEGFSKKADAKGYEIIVDTKGKLLWPDASDMDKPYLIIGLQDRVRQDVGRRDRAGRRGVARHLPSVGCHDQRETRQGPFPPRPGQGPRGLRGDSGAPAKNRRVV